MLWFTFSKQEWDWILFPSSLSLTFPIFHNELSHVPSLCHCFFIVSWYCPSHYWEKRVLTSWSCENSLLVRAHHFLPLHLKLMQHCHPHLFFWYLIHSFFHSFIYPLIYLMKTYWILLCARHSAQCCKWVSELDTNPADKENKDALFPLQGWQICLHSLWFPFLHPQKLGSTNTWSGLCIYK